MYLAKHFMDKLLEAGVQVDYMNKEAAKYANSMLDLNDPPDFCGYYWSITKNGKVQSAPGVLGPFRSPSAAYSSAYKQLGLGVWKPKLVKNYA